MESRVRAVLSGLGACAALGLFLVGVPVCLVKLVGNPLPAAVPSWSSVVAAVEGGTLPAGALSGVLAVAVWIWWSQAVLSVVAEVRAARRGRAARSLPLRGLGMQPIMIRLVAVVVGAAATVGTLAQPTLAATASFADIAVPMTTGEVSGGMAGESGSGTPIVGTGSLATVGPPPAPVLGPPEVPVAEVDGSPPAPVLGLADESRPATVMSQPAPAAARATSARWDPVLESGTVERADQMPIERADPVSVERADPVSVERADQMPIERADPVSVERADPVSVERADPVSVERADPVSAAEPGEPAWVVVKPGDSLWLLAELHLGDAMRWPEIFELNAGQLDGGGTLRDPNLIHPGWRLRLPPPDPPAPSEPWVAAPEGVPATPAGLPPR